MAPPEPALGTVSHTGSRWRVKAFGGKSQRCWDPLPSTFQELWHELFVPRTPRYWAGYGLAGFSLCNYVEVALLIHAKIIKSQSLF